MPDLLKYLPLIMQLVNLIPKIQDALRNKTSVIDLLNQFGPELLPVIQQIAQAFFPNLNLNPTQQAAAGALVLSPEIVRDLQTQLNRLGITDDAGQALATDGSYGARTKQAVAKFQKANNLTADGWAGAQTQAALAQAIAKLPAA